MLYANDVKINPTLAGSISGIGSPGYAASGAIDSQYDAARKRLARGAGVMGTPNPLAPNSYATNRLNTAQGLDMGGLASALGGGVADTSYKDTLNERGYNQNVQLANEIANLRKPDTLSQIFQGLGTIGGAGAEIYGAYGTGKSPKSRYAKATPDYADANWEGVG